MNDEVSASGKFPMIPPETQEAMRTDRMARMTLEQIAEKYHCSINSVRKYTGDVVSSRQPKAKVEVSNELELDKEVKEAVLSQHAGEVLDNAKKLDLEIISGGKALKEHLASKGIDIDLTKIPRDQAIRLLRSPGLGEHMNSDLKVLFDEFMATKNPSPAKGKVNIDDLKEMMIIRAFEKMISGDGDGPQSQNASVQQMIIDLKAENEKQRQFYEQKQKEQDEKIRDMLFEKRMQTMEEKQVDTVANLSDQLEGLQNSITQLKSIPNPSPEQRTALDELGEAASQLNKIKSTLIEMGLVQAAPGTVVMHPPDIYKNADGSLDFTRYAGDKLESTVRMITEAMSKRAPERTAVKATPTPEHNLTLDQAEQLYQQLTQKSTMTQTESDWVNQYLPVREQYFPSAPDIVPASSPVASSPAYPVELASAVPDKVPAEAASEYTDPAELLKPIEPNKTVIERLKEKDNSTAQALADLGF